MDIICLYTDETEIKIYIYLCFQCISIIFQNIVRKPMKLSDVFYCILASIDVYTRSTLDNKYVTGIEIMLLCDPYFRVVSII